ncbi:hypothetical protein HGH93_09640 [Chitinophaga polysaccharea]|uniref:hypothetical protein n=1 Tax=Chitinophaga TaxID=79328 RepID=UPI0014552885|nr:MULTISPECIES: hypothetical protein [Chitinophaga]NLR58360.1 hypothetical protein [Chitinophaga polysaccharea]NLU90887.1 hypothetical protein [Chitinophaga sp. Ak27]
MKKIALLFSAVFVSALLFSFTDGDEGGGKVGYYCDQSTSTACTFENTTGGYTVYSTGLLKRFL